jgi:methenyltetrahydrofolate cyclohydrolase
MVRNQPIEQFLTQLSEHPPPAGGAAVAGLHAAQAAALLLMVARYSGDGDAAGHAALVERVREQAEVLRQESLHLAEEDPAAEPPVAVMATAARLVVLAEQLLPASHPRVVADVATAAEAIRAAAATCRVSIEANLHRVADEGERERLTAVAAGAETIATRAEAVTAAVRGMLVT